MREHPIPQDVTGYKFHIVGNMTLKQFAEIGLGCVIAFIFYTTNLPTIFKWPLIGISIALGAGAAFIPIQERPLDHWIITFFKTLYSPTKFYWRRQSKIPEPFLYNANANIQPTEPEVDLTPARRERIKEYLHSVQKPNLTPYEEYQQQREQNILGTFASVDADIINTTQTPKSASQPVAKKPVKPTLGIRQRSLPSVQIMEERTQVANEAVTLFEAQEKKAKPTKIVETDTLSVPKIKVVKEQSTQNSSKSNKEDKTNAPSISGHTYAQDTAKTPQIPKPQNNQNTEAQTNEFLPFPSPPEKPNLLVGMALTASRELVPQAIVEITNEAGAVVRAIKTNALGQFFVTTPLPNGNYNILVEKEPLQFTQQQISLVGEVVPPIEIRAS